MNNVITIIIIIFGLCAIVVNFINYKFYSDFRNIERGNNKHRKPAHLTLKESKERYYSEYRYAVVNVGRGNYPLWLCKNIEDAKEKVRYSCQSLYIVDLGDVR